MKKLASVLVLAMLLSSLLLVGVAFAQTGTGTGAGSSADPMTVTVTVSDNDVTLSPDTVSANQQVNFEFASSDAGQDMSNACVVVLGENDDTPLNTGSGAAATPAATGTPASGSGDNEDCNTYTFEDAGTYRIAVYEGTDLSQFEFGDDTNFATLTVVQGTAGGGAGSAQTTTTPAATGTSAATAQATVQATSTVSATGTASGVGASGTAQATPGSLPTTGGETNNWVPVALMLGALALVAGGVLRFAFRNR